VFLQHSEILYSETELDKEFRELKQQNKLLFHRSPKRNIRVCMEELWLKYKSLYGDQELTLNLFNLWVIYRIKTLEHSVVSFFSHPGEFKRDLSKF